MEDNIKKTCPFCKLDIKDGEATTTCATCASVHHEACWKKNGGCAVVGCPERRVNPTEVVNPYVCSTCNSPFGSEHNYCSGCGTPRLPGFEKVCGFCGSPLRKGQKFCTNCGKEVKGSIA
ncbi:MAG: zinc ribbon domain-containing protein [Oscillospiraceae bacterium]|jgi:predicted amidophosphoribosyltransferase|nr:zinc ribbon domain-containing protein [Oscillospiraceae bacterium]